LHPFDFELLNDAEQNFKRQKTKKPPFPAASIFVVVDATV